MKGGFLLMQMHRQFCLSLYSHPVTFVPDAYTHFGTLTISLSVCFPCQGRHVKTGQLAAIKVMEVTEVRVKDISFDTLHIPALYIVFLIRGMSFFLKKTLLIQVSN